MQTVILCGGMGSRIRDVSELVPKPMLPLGDRPILWHIMKLYAHHGLKDFVLCLGYKGSVIREYFLNFKAMTADCTVELGTEDVRFHDPIDENDWRVTLAQTGAETMTGGRLIRARRHLVGDHFALTYGDGVADVDIDALVEAHVASGRVATVTAVRVAGRFGELEVADGVVRRFDEKPPLSTGVVSGGFFVFDNRRVWDYLDPRDDLILEREPLSRLVEAGELGVYRHEGYWQCMDTPREFALLNELWRSGRAPWRVW